MLENINTLNWPVERPYPLNKIRCQYVKDFEHALQLLVWRGSQTGLLVHENSDTGTEFNNLVRLFITSNQFWFSTNATPNSRQVIDHYGFGDIYNNSRFFLNLFLVVFCHDFFGSDKRYLKLIEIILDTLEFYKPYVNSRSPLAIGFVLKEVLSAVMSYNSDPNPNHYWVPGVAKHSAIHDFFSSFLLAFPHVRMNEQGKLLRLVDSWPTYISAYQAHLAFLEPLGNEYPRFGGSVLCAPLIFNTDLHYKENFSTLFRSDKKKISLTFVKGKLWSAMDHENYLPDTKFEEISESHYLLDESLYGQSGFMIPRFNINGKLVPKVPTMKWQSTSVVVKILKDIHNFYNYEDRAYLHTVLQKRSLTGLKELDLLLKEIGFLDDLAIISNYRKYYSSNPGELEDWHIPNIAFTHKLVDNLLLAFLGGIPKYPYNRVISEALHPPRKKSWSFFR